VHAFPLAPRRHMSGAVLTFKFVIDGKWLCDGALPIVKDEHGNVNNVVQLDATGCPILPSKVNTRLKRLAAAAAAGTVDRSSGQQLSSSAESLPIASRDIAGRRSLQEAMENINSRIFVRERRQPDPGARAKRLTLGLKRPANRYPASAPCALNRLGLSAARLETIAESDESPREDEEPISFSPANFPTHTCPGSEQPTGDSPAEESVGADSPVSEPDWRSREQALPELDLAGVRMSLTDTVNTHPFFHGEGARGRSVEITQRSLE